ncbi:MAG: hypothetical protein JXA71_02500 [Chitinispirillaceae bacterium]|nr:hypothetical protein [Chitinispirillaceae bacterium]
MTAMKLSRRALTLAAIAAMSLTGSNDTKNPTIDFYDNEKTHDLIVRDTLSVGGEIANPGPVDVRNLPLRQVIVKEAVLEKNGTAFIGAYRYEGYALYDILNHCIVKKKNEKEFRGCIDLYVTIENKKGEKTVFSWGEIYYPVHRYAIIIATKVMRIVPSKTKEKWPLPTESKVVAACDLLTERNISNPTKITVHSFPRSYKGTKGLQPLIADSIVFVMDSTKKGFALRALPDSLQRLDYHTVFYGRGRGIHGISAFRGVPLKDVISGFLPQSARAIRSVLFCFGAPDGYRCTFTYSEIVNRNDQAETLLMQLKKGADGGRFKLFPAADFFSDRAIKAVSEVYGMTVK